MYFIGFMYFIVTFPEPGEVTFCRRWPMSPRSALPSSHQIYVFLYTSAMWAGSPSVVVGWLHGQSGMYNCWFSRPSFVQRLLPLVIEARSWSSWLWNPIGLQGQYWWIWPQTSFKLLLLPWVPEVCEILCASLKSNVSISHSPLAV